MKTDIRLSLTLSLSFIFACSNPVWLSSSLSSFDCHIFILLIITFVWIIHMCLVFDEELLHSRTIRIEKSELKCQQYHTWCHLVFSACRTRLLSNRERTRRNWAYIYTVIYLREFSLSFLLNAHGACQQRWVLILLRFLKYQGVYILVNAKDRLEQVRDRSKFVDRCVRVCVFFCKRKKIDK